MIPCVECDRAERRQLIGGLCVRVKRDTEPISQQCLCVCVCVCVCLCVCVFVRRAERHAKTIVPERLKPLNNTAACELFNKTHTHTLTLSQTHTHTHTPHPCPA